MREFNAYLRTVAATSVANSLVSALSIALLLPLVVARIGLDAYGLWAVLGIFVGISSILDLGIWKSIVYVASKGQYIESELVASALLVCTLLGLAFSALLVTAVALGAPLFGHVLAAAPEAKWWLCLSGIVVVFASLYANIVRGVLEAHFKIHVANIGYAALTLLQYALAAVVTLLSRDPVWLIAVSASTYVLVFAGLLVYARAKASFRISRPRAGAARLLLGYGVRSFLSELPATMLGPIVLYLFVLHANGAKEYGIFDVSLRIALLAASALGMLSQPLFSLVASASGRDAAEARRRVSSFLRVTVLLGIVGCAVYYFAGHRLLGIAFAEGVDAMFDASLPMLCGAAAAAALEPIARLLMGLGKLELLTLTRVAMLMATIVGIEALAGVPALERFSIAVALGYGLGAVGLVLANRAVGLPSAGKQGVGS